MPTTCEKHKHIFWPRQATDSNLRQPCKTTNFHRRQIIFFIAHFSPLIFVSLTNQTPRSVWRHCFVSDTVSIALSEFALWRQLVNLTWLWDWSKVKLWTVLAGVRPQIPGFFAIMPESQETPYKTFKQRKSFGEYPTSCISNYFKQPVVCSSSQSRKDHWRVAEQQV